MKCFWEIERVKNLIKLAFIAGEIRLFPKLRFLTKSYVRHNFLVTVFVRSFHLVIFFFFGRENPI